MDEREERSKEQGVVHVSSKKRGGRDMLLGLKRSYLATILLVHSGRRNLFRFPASAVS